MTSEQGDIIITQFPYSDLTTIKKRPAIIISHNKYNHNAQDVLICAITSNLMNNDYSVVIGNKQLQFGRIPVKSLIKINKLTALHKKIIIKLNLLKLIIKKRKAFMFLQVIEIIK